MYSTRPFHFALSCLSDLFLFILLRSFSSYHFKVVFFLLPFCLFLRGHDKTDFRARHSNALREVRWQSSAGPQTGNARQLRNSTGYVPYPLSTAYFCEDELTHNRY